MHQGNIDKFNKFSKNRQLFHINLRLYVLRKIRRVRFNAE